jgi:hypothetical protein
MDDEQTREQEQQPSEEPRREPYEPPAIVALGKLDKITFGAPGPPFEGATSYF